MWELDHKKAEWWKTDAFKLWCWRRLLRVPWTSRRSNQSILKEISALNIHWKDWCWSWSSNTLATWCEEPTHWKRLKAGGEGDDRGSDGCMASLTQWTQAWVDSRSWWWTGRPVVLWFMGSQRVRHNWVTELNWTELMIPSDFSLLFVFATNFNVVATFYCTWILEGLQWGKSQPTLNVMCSCCCSATQPWPILCDPVDYRLQASLSFTISQSYSNSCPLSQWCHPTISCLQCFPASGSFLMSQLFASGGQSIGVSASASVLSMNIQGWFPLGLIGLISLLSREF